MRTATIKMKGHSCYYHACARIAGAKDEYLFTDVDKEKGMKIVQDLTRLFFLEPVSMCWMGNHWHIVVYFEDSTPSLEETADRYNAYYGKNRIPLDPKLDPQKCRKVGEQLNDISFLCGRCIRSSPFISTGFTTVVGPYGRTVLRVTFWKENRRFGIVLSTLN